MTYWVGNIRGETLDIPTSQPGTETSSPIKEDFLVLSACERPRVSEERNPHKLIGVKILPCADALTEILGWGVFLSSCLVAL